MGGPAISALALHAWQQRKGEHGADAALIIDGRPARQFQRGHLPGSHSIPVARLLSTELPDGDLILITEQSPQAMALIDQLHSSGYGRRVRYLEGGLAGWRLQGLPLQTAERPGLSLDLLSGLRPLLGALLLLVLAGSRWLAPLIPALGQLLGPWSHTRAKA
ncbi:MAG: rhodanese-like domain-containing protein [Cyanobium sp.]